MTRDAYETWEATTDPEADVELRIRVLEWVLGLHDGPPSRGAFDPHRETMFCEVDDTGVWVEYLVLPYLDPPAIVIRAYR